ncbi:MAG: hypothetical protein AB7Q17_14475 [Phycisphaerae bacterium]
MRYNERLRGWGRCVAAAAVVLLASPLNAQTIQSIGALSPTGTSTAYGVSADGSAVVGYANSSGVLRAIRWTSAGGLQNLGVPPTGIRSIGFAISADGYAVTGLCVLPGTGHVFLWTAESGLEDLGTLPIQNVSYGFAISGDGLVIGGGPSTGAEGHAFTWDSASGFVDLNKLPGGLASALYGLNADGSAGAGFSGTTLGDRAVLWTRAGGMEDLGVLAGGATSKGNAISADGTAIAGTSDSSLGQRAFRWTRSGGMEDLGTAAGRSTSDGLAISADGSIVAGRDELGAILWTRETGCVDLPSFLAARGVNLAGWTLAACYGVSRDGTALAGEGRLNGQLRGWVVRGLPSLCAPQITQQPAPAAGCSGALTPFSVVAAAGSDLTYEWQIEAASGVWATLGETPLPLPCGGAAHALNPHAADVLIGVTACSGVSSYSVRALVSNACQSVPSNSAALSIVTTGDLNCDCAVNNFDIDAFVLALTNPDGYAAAFPGCDRANADTDHDGMVNNFDIDAFVACLTDGACP